MKHNKKRLAILLAGILCAALTGAAVWYDLTYNGGRLVYPMHSYAFQPTDIPMIAAVTLDILYAAALCIFLVLAAAAGRRRVQTTNRTRRLNPKLGFLGILGFAGFFGFYSYVNYDQYFPFCFFVFFGFFGFFFEGRMSNTFMDERYRENALHAERDACRVGMTVLFLLLVVAGQGRASAALILPILLTGISLDLALTLFLSVYLLYRYDHEDAAMESE